MFEGVIHGPQHRAHVQLVQDSFDMVRRGVPLEQGFAVFVHVGGQGRRVQRTGRIGGGNLDEHLVLQTDVAECQFTVRAGAGKELDDVFLVPQPDAEREEQQETACEKQVQQPLLPLEKVIDRNEYPVHTFGFLFNAQKYVLFPKK